MLTSISQVCLNTFVVANQVKQANNVVLADMSATEVLKEIIQVLVSGITEMGKGIGEGISSIAKSMFFTTSGDTQTLSTWAILILVFAGISLAVGLTRMIYTWLSTLGN